MNACKLKMYSYACIFYLTEGNSGTRKQANITGLDSTHTEVNTGFSVEQTLLFICTGGHIVKL